MSRPSKSDALRLAPAMTKSEIVDDSITIGSDQLPTYRR